MSEAIETGRDAPLQRAADGAGRLIQRDYWALIDGCHHSPREVAANTFGLVEADQSLDPQPARFVIYTE